MWNKNIFYLSSSRKYEVYLIFPVEMLRYLDILSCLSSQMLAVAENGRLNWSITWVSENILSRQSAKSHVTLHKSHVTHYKSNFTSHTSHVTSQTSQVTSYKSHVTCHNSHVTSDKLQVTRYKSNVTSHKSQITITRHKWQVARHESQFSRPVRPVIKVKLKKNKSKNKILI